MSSYLNINKLHEELEQRRIRRRMIYETVIESITKRIQYTNSTSDKCFLLYPVPGFISGMPIRNRPECMQHVMSQVSDMGFIVRFVQPNYIYVSWRHVKYQPVDPLTMLDSNPNGLGELVNTPGAVYAATYGYRLPETGTISNNSKHSNSGKNQLMTFSDQVRANRNPGASKMIAFDSIDEQFLAGNEHYNPNFKPGSLRNMDPEPPNDDVGVPSHIMRAHRPYLDPMNPSQPEPSLPTQQQNTIPQQIKSVSVNTGGRGNRRNSTIGSRGARASNGPLNLDDLLSPKSTGSNRMSTVMPISASSNEQIASDNQRINEVLNHFGSRRPNPNAPPPGGMPPDMQGTLL